ncbi:hypothetical protein ACF09K_09395 [Streptomyces sp. NPDC014882]|uniref:hypothetical protein n=1 Tax=Streptomyces sp. NPDC014882 TaxID=3364927 RepID=UPI003700BB3F
MHPEMRDESDEKNFPVKCDECGTTLCVEPQRGSYPHPVILPDSSAVGAHPSDMDGQRMATACSEACRRAIEERFLRRPFVPEELWAGKLKRALAASPEGMKPPELLERSGLTEAQMGAGFRWLAGRCRPPEGRESDEPAS